MVPQRSRAIAGIGPLAPYYQVIGLGALVLAITLASLVLTELVPMRIALGRPERIAPVVSRPFGALALLTVLVVGLLSAATDRVLGALGVRPAHEPPVTEEEISVLLQAGTKAGVFEEGEHE